MAFFSHRITLIVIAMCGVLIAWFYTIYYKEEQNGASIRRNFELIDIPRIQWPEVLSQDETKNFIYSISMNRTVVVITNHPYFSKLKEPMLTPKDLISYFDDSNEFSGDLEYKSNRNCPIFSFYEEHLPLIDIIDWQPPNNSSKLHTKMAQYWQYISRQTDFLQNTNIKNYDIYSCSMQNHFEYRSLSINMHPKDSIIENVYNEHLKFLIPKHEKLQTIKIWMGSKGVLTKFHYDASDNFNIQINGKKLFRIIAPKYHWNLKHFPWLHPESRKSQIGKNGIYGYEDMNADIYETVLNAGEIIYIPPTWDHEVIGMGESINLNVWSEGIEALIQENMTKHPLPFDIVERGIDEKITKHKMMAIVLQKYIQCLLIEFCQHFGLSGDCNHKFIQMSMKKMVKSRYDPLFEHENDVQRYDLCNYESWLKNDRFSEWYKDEITNKEEKYQKYANTLIKEEMPDIDHEVALIFLTAYFEIIAEYFLGIDNVYTFFSICF